MITKWRIWEKSEVRCERCRSSEVFRNKKQIRQADLRVLVRFTRNGDFFVILNSLFEDCEFILSSVVKFVFWYVLKGRVANVVMLVITIT